MGKCAKKYFTKKKNLGLPLGFEMLHCIFLSPFCPFFFVTGKRVEILCVEDKIQLIN